MRLSAFVLLILLFESNSEVVKDNFVYKPNDGTEQVLKEIDVVEKVQRCTNDVMVSFFDKEKKGIFF
jgi:hypothetical protein